MTAETHEENVTNSASREQCPNFHSCSAQLCPLDEKSIQNCTWFPDEEICRSKYPFSSDCAYGFSERAIKGLFSGGSADMTPNTYSEEQAEICPLFGPQPQSRFLSLERRRETLGRRPQTPKIVTRREGTTN